MSGSPAADTGHVHVELDLDVHAQPIRGTLHAASGSQAFSGWLALITELDGLRARQGRHEEEEHRP